MWGKLVLGAVGFMIGGPIGAGVGLALGDGIDTAEEPSQKAEEQVRTAYFVCFFSSLAKIAKADGKITKDEIDAVKNIFKDFELDEQQKESAIQIFNEAKNNTSTIKEYTDQLAKLIEYERETGEGFLRYFFDIASSDGNISDAELALLYEAENSFRLRQGTVDELIGNNQSAENEKMSFEEAYSLLGCSSTMTEKEIKSVYRKKCNDFHPDKLHSKNLPPEFIKFANQETAKINEAYKIILASYGQS